MLSPPSRVLTWDGCSNVRDLGGLPTEDGSQTRFGAVVRADDLVALSETGWRALRAYGVRRIVDLRHEEEPYETSIEVVRIPLLDPPSIAEVDRLFAGEDDPVVWRRENYLFFLERFPQAFAGAVEAVAAAGEGGVLVHCAGGVDRTGLVSALLLRTAGVGIDVIADDYAASEASWAPTVGEWIAQAPDEAERRKRRLLSIIPAAAMREVLLELERRHGAPDGYLRAAGVGERNLKRVRARLL